MSQAPTGPQPLQRRQQTRRASGPRGARGVLAVGTEQGSQDRDVARGRAGEGQPGSGEEAGCSSR